MLDSMNNLRVLGRFIPEDISILIAHKAQIHFFKKQKLATLQK